MFYKLIFHISERSVRRFIDKNVYKYSKAIYWYSIILRKWCYIALNLYFLHCIFSLHFVYDTNSICNSTKRFNILVTTLFLFTSMFCACLKRTFYSQFILASQTIKVIVLGEKFSDKDAGTFACEKEFEISYKYLYSVKVYIVSQNVTCKCTYKGKNEIKPRLAF